MNECKFCSEEPIKHDVLGNIGFRTTHQTIQFIFKMEQDEAPSDYIKWDQENKIMWANTSSGEYVNLGFKINYCPYCGRKLVENDTRLGKC